RPPVSLADLFDPTLFCPFSVPLRSPSPLHRVRRVNSPVPPPPVLAHCSAKQRFQPSQPKRLLRRSRLAAKPESSFLQIPCPSFSGFPPLHWQEEERLDDSWPWTRSKPLRRQGK